MSLRNVHLCFLIAAGFCAVASAQVAPTAAAPAKAPAKAASASPAKGGAQQQPLEIKLERKKVATVEGKEALVAADSVKPGEVLVETATYTNKSQGRLTKAELNLPIPANTVFEIGSTQPAAARASTDGKTYAAIPLVRKVTGANGVVTEQPVPAADYRFLRWTVDVIEPGKSITVSARMKVADGSAARR